MPFDSNFTQEIEQAVIQKQALIASLSNPEMDQARKQLTNQKIDDLTSFLNNFYNSVGSSNDSKTSLSELNLQAKLDYLQKNIEVLTIQNQELRTTIQNGEKNMPVLPGSQNKTTQKIISTVNQNFGQASTTLSDKIIQNTVTLTGVSPRTLKEYLYLGWDYLVRDRLPKLLSTRLFLVVGGGYITERLGTDTTLKIVSIVLLVVFYIISEMVVKLATKMGDSRRFY